mmetsp:Transcript_79077/g.219724  ORF Transcript_79077/g.219724 Transcript_79077/m.219724 type:complete len:213 (+) Transcript_79077:142-780(+)
MRRRTKSKGRAACARPAPTMDRRCPPLNALEDLRRPASSNYEQVFVEVQYLQVSAEARFFLEHNAVRVCGQLGNFLYRFHRLCGTSQDNPRPRRKALRDLHGHRIDVGLEHVILPRFEQFPDHFGLAPSAHPAEPQRPSADEEGGLRWPFRGALQLEERHLASELFLGSDGSSSAVRPTSSVLVQQLEDFAFVVNVEIIEILALLLVCAHRK